MSEIGGSAGQISVLNGTNVLQRRYAYIGVAPLMLVVGVNRYWFLNDHLGTPRRLVDAMGTVVWSADYEAFGRATVGVSSTVIQPIRFPGQYADAETGLHYNRNRYYMPAWGRYLDPDIFENFAGLDNT